MISKSFRRVVCFAGLLLSAALVASAAPPQGERWQTTSQISMEGMPMAIPPQTVEVCARKDWKAPPSDPNRHCQTSDVVVSGSKITWKQHCTDPEMSGTGEIARQGADAYSGALHMSSAHGDMTMKLSGRRTGTCDDPQ